MSASSIEVAFGCASIPTATCGPSGSPTSRRRRRRPGRLSSLAQTILAMGSGIGRPDRPAGSSPPPRPRALTVGAPVIGVLPVAPSRPASSSSASTCWPAPLVDQRRGMPAADYLVVLIIPAVTAAFGFLWGVASGLLAAALFFIVTFARIDVVRLATTGARLRSRIERPDTEQARLAVLGRRGLHLRPRGLPLLRHRRPLGAARRGRARPDARPAIRPPSTSAGSAASTPRRRARSRGSTRPAAPAASRSTSPGSTTRRARDPRAASGPRRRVVRRRLEQALEQVEAALLAGDRRDGNRAPGFLDELRRRHPATDLARYFATAVASPPAPRSSRRARRPTASWCCAPAPLRIEVVVDGAAPITVAHCRPGTLVGEIGLYAGVPRTARVVAERPSVVPLRRRRAPADGARRPGPAGRLPPAGRRDPRPPPRPHHGARSPTPRSSRAEAPASVGLRPISRPIVWRCAPAPPTRPIRRVTDRAWSALPYMTASRPTGW